ncbi:chemotaxis protein CheD [Achromobacter aloeverae]|uniref:Probable chemoreceptor glutamine deamidase CheD n=1 Tax=Achromobacter aloeverae TaxID=1750518 RepID=A0A4Q1HFS5_9BURK|nr:chemotaxis protein CheD [Achromobacter aloeverae]
MDMFLQPGSYIVGDARFRVRTILGSCVSITLWHPGRREGAMSHFLLASRPRHGDQPLDGRYGAEAVHLMVRALERKGIGVQECEAKIFGGGNMFPDRPHPHVVDIGRRNGEAARELLRQYGVAVRSEHLFGSGHRQVIFSMATGDVWVKQISLPPSAPTIT